MNAYKSVVHTRLCMAFSYLKQPLHCFVLSKSYDMSKSIIRSFREKRYFRPARDHISVSDSVPERP